MSQRECISRTAINDTLLLDAFLHAYTTARQLSNKAVWCESSLGGHHSCPEPFSTCEQLRTYGGGDAGHFRGCVLPPSAHSRMACAIDTSGRASRACAFQLDIEQDCPLACLTRVPIGSYRQHL